MGASDDAFVREHFSNELSLDSVIVTRNFAETVREEALETLENEDWCDMSVHVPTDFSIEDIRLLLSHTSFSEWKDTVVLTETCLVKTSFIEVELKFLFESQLVLRNVVNMSDKWPKNWQKKISVR